MRRLGCLIIWLVILIAVDGCSDEEQTPATQAPSTESLPPASDADLVAALELGARRLVSLGTAMDASSQAVAANLGTRDGLGALQGLRALSVANFAAGTPLGPGTRPEDPSLPAWTAALRAIVADAAPVAPEVLAGIPHDLGPEQQVAWLFAGALHCKDEAFPSTWDDEAMQVRSSLSEARGQFLAALAVAAMDERSCTSDGSRALRDELVARNSAVLATDELRVETFFALAILAVVGEPPPDLREWANLLVAVQQPDGSWMTTDADTDWGVILAGLITVSAALEGSFDEPLTITG